jgi:hypothetical protein
VITALGVRDKVICQTQSEEYRGLADVRFRARAIPAFEVPRPAFPRHGGGVEQTDRIAVLVGDQDRWNKDRRKVVFHYRSASCAAMQNQRQEDHMIDASQIKEQMAVKGSDGKHVGTVIGVEKDRLKLASGGMDHDIDLDMVDEVDSQTVRLRKTAEEAVRSWH